MAAIAAKAHASHTSPSTERSDNPFDSLFDGGDDDHSGSEWWDEDTADSSSSKDKIPILVSQWPKPPETVGLGVHVKSTKRMSLRQHTKRYSVQKPVREKSKGRQKKQNANAGIKVVTDFSRHQPPAAPVQLQPSQTMPQTGRFVDMAALRALNGESNQSSGGFWRTKKNKALSRAPNTAPTLTKDSTAHAETLLSSKYVGTRNDFLQSPVRPGEDLSPNDRPIVIGISIPSSDISVHSVSPQTAVSETSKIVHNYGGRMPTGHTPDTPTIIITPAQEASAWSPLGMQGMSSDHQLYESNSQSARHYTANDAPPVPQMPNSFLENERQRIAAQKSYFSPDSDDVTTWGDDDEIHASPRSRVVSSYTVFEEDESPVMARTGRAVSVTTNGTRAGRHASISTVATQRRSRGWWNYITTPFLTRSNTFATREAENQQAPALPDMAIAVAKAQAAERDAKKWEKQFSPLTPATSTTIASDQWWDLDAKRSEQSPVVRDTRHKVQTSTGTLPIVLSETAGFGAASMSDIASLNTDQLSRENTTSSFACTGEADSSEREVPILADAPRTRSLRSNNPFAQQTPGNPNESSQRSQSGSGELTDRAPPPGQPGQNTYSPSVGGPPPYSPSPARVKYKAILPPGHAPPATQYPVSPGPVSPGLQQAMSSGGAIPMSEVPLSPPARRPINLNSGYPVLPARQLEVPVSGEHYGLPPTKASKKAEAKRRRHEKEEAIAHRAGGFWRGRGCVPSRGCYGRSGPEGRKRRRWYLFLIIFFLALIVLIIVLATTLHRKSNTVTQPSQWLNLTGFPPIFLGLSTVVAPINIESNTGCVFPATQWSCDIPKELQSTVSSANQPNFFLYVQWDNSSATNATFANVTGNKNLVTRAGNPVSAGQFMKHLLVKARDIVTFSPNPAPPTFAEESFLGNTTDGIVSSNKAGEPTPFYISFLPSLNASTSSVKKRQSLSAEGQAAPVYDEVLDERDSDPFPNVTQTIPPPSLNGDGTAAPANLLPSPLPLQQPIRLYDRGLPTEHYGFYSYFDRSIFLKSLTLLNETNLQNGEVPDDLNGGATEAEANFRCTWSETRFLVQMWTRLGSSARLNNATSSSYSPGAQLREPGSFPYPITITTDRHGGSPSAKMIYCYAMNDRQGLVVGSAKLQGENRAFGGAAVNPAPTVFFNASTTTLGGFDGGSGGCACAWSNFGKVVSG